MKKRLMTIAFILAMAVCIPAIAFADEDAGPGPETMSEAGEAVVGNEAESEVCELTEENTIVTGVKDVEYAGKEITFPDLTVSVNGSVLRENVDYQIDYYDNCEMGEATICISGIGDYYGGINVYFIIRPPRPAIDRLAPLKKAMYVTWKADSEMASKYQVQYSTSADFSTKKTVNKQYPYAKITGLKAKKTYYVRVRVFAEAFGNEIASAWSKTMKVKTFDRNKNLPLYTGDGWHDIIIDQMVKKAGIKKTMTAGQKSKKAFVYLAKNFKYTYEVKKRKCYHKNPTKKQIAAMEAKVRKLENQGKVKISTFYIPLDEGFIGEEDVIIRSSEWRYHTGVCDNFSQVYASICRRVGVTAGMCGGLSPAGNPHAWNWIKLGGKTYYVDPGKAIHRYTKTKKVHYECYKMKKKMVKKYKLTEKF